MSISITYKNSSQVGQPALATQHDQVRNQLDAQLLPHADQLLSLWFGSTRTSGAEVIMRNPLRNDENLGSFKFNTQTGAWSDFAVDGFKGYGLTMLYSATLRVPMVDAISKLQELAQDITRIPASTPAIEKREKPKVEAVNPDAVILPPDCHADLGFPSMQWEYRDANGRLIFYIQRYDHDDKKETRPLSWAPDKNAWQWQYPDSPYPAYHLPDLLARPDATVIITEGEKTADAAAQQFPETVAITSACGSDQALRTD